jgi:hypothetical protein
VDRRALTLIAAAGLALAVPAWANAATDADALLAQSNTGTLTAQGIAAGEDTGGLSKNAKPSAKSASTDAASDGVAADELPFTGSDPRITLLLGLAALLAGAGMRMRTGDARDF